MVLWSDDILVDVLFKCVKTNSKCRISSCIRLVDMKHPLSLSLSQVNLFMQYKI